jgi:hypothetical protein
MHVVRKTVNAARVENLELSYNKFVRGKSYAHLAQLICCFPSPSLFLYPKIRFSFRVSGRFVLARAISSL